MEQLLSMGFSQELASQALAATGGESILKATEWLLFQRAEEEVMAATRTTAAVTTTTTTTTTTATSVAAAATATEASPQGVPSSKQQVRLDRFFCNQAPPSPHASPPAAANKRREGNFHEHNKVCPPPSEFRDTPKARNTPSPVKRLPPFPSSSPLGSPSKRKHAGDGSDPCTKAASLQPPDAFKTPSSLPQCTSSTVPLAERMRPSSVDEIVGQDHLLGPGCILRSLVENDTMVSVIFWGPPGTGKTSLARAIARSISCYFIALSAGSSGVKDVREILEEAKCAKKTGQRTLFFMDEVHRFNKTQQDALLPSIEAGHVIFMGATTENPSFELNATLLSRCKVLTLNKLQPESIKQVLERALSSGDRGVMAPFAEDPLVQKIDAEKEALDFLAETANGDVRVALNALEIAVASAVARERQRSKSAQEDSSRPCFADMDDKQVENATPSPMATSRSTNALNVRKELHFEPSEPKETLGSSQEQFTYPFKRFVGGRAVKSCSSSTDREEQAHDLRAGEAIKSQGSVPNTTILVRLVDISKALQRSHLLYDKRGEEHCNVMSALHKSMRGGDHNAALYWLARMMEGGEDPLYIARRLIRFASEDVGLDDPQALTLAVACYQACHFLGMPECNVHLAECVAYLSIAPKSVAVYQAIEAAQELVKKRGYDPVPLHLRNAPTDLTKQFGYGRGYIHPLNHKGPVEQEYLPLLLRGQKFLKWP